MKLAEKDLRTSIGRTLQYAAVNCAIGNDYEQLTPSLVKRKLRYAEIPEDQKWRVPFVQELRMLKHRSLELDGFLAEEIGAILTHICTS